MDSRPGRIYAEALAAQRRRDMGLDGPTLPVTFVPMNSPPAPERDAGREETR